MHGHDGMQIGAESNVNSPMPCVRTIRQLLFRTSAPSTAVRRRVSTSDYKSQFSLSTVRCEVCMSSVLVDQVLRRCCLCCAELAGKGPDFFTGFIVKARQLMSLTFVKLLQFVFSKIPATLTVGLIFMKRISPF